jgi:CDP-paratose 2-epimerase
MATHFYRADPDERKKAIQDSINYTTLRRALVTGSSGLVGSESVRFLAAKGFKVFGIDNNLRHHFVGQDGSTDSERIFLNHTLATFSPLEADIRDRAAVERIFKYYGPFDLIIHAAGQPAHDWATEHPIEDFQINAVGSLVMLENFRQYSKDATFNSGFL